ncbi:MAG: MCP four helix bundle domain-containing protein [bacterium]|nr:MCP four helix bundle domain-containing protein [bacterium]
MSWKDIQIGKKLYIGFGIVIVLTIIVGYVGFSGLNTVERRAGNVNFAEHYKIQCKKRLRSVATSL